MKNNSLFFLLLYVFVLSGCGVRHTLNGLSSGSFPLWLKQPTMFWEQNGNYYFKHYAETKADYVLSAQEEKFVAEELKEVAELQAIAKVAEQINSMIKSKTEYIKVYSKNIYGKHSFGTDVLSKTKNEITSSIGGLLLKGITLESTYMQKSVIKNGTRKSIYYRSYVLISISKKNYEKIQKENFNNKK